MKHEDYMALAFDEAFNGFRNNKGGPFGAIVVLENKIVGRGCNLVTSTNDPTAHAEVVAIRNACSTAQSFHLQNALLYTTCEPCPMCLAAIYWAHIHQVYYCSTRLEAKNIGFDDDLIYKELGKEINARTKVIHQIRIDAGEKCFSEWLEKNDRKHY